MGMVMVSCPDCPQIRDLQLMFVEHLPERSATFVGSCEKDFVPIYWAQLIRFITFNAI